MKTTTQPNPTEHNATIKRGIDAHAKWFYVACQFDGATPQPVEKMTLEALLRRVQRHIEFRLPDASMRRELLALHLPNPERVKANLRFASGFLHCITNLAEQSGGLSGGVDVEFLGDLLDGPDPLERLKCHAGLELGVVSSAFSFHFVYVRFVFSAATVHHNHSLASGPIFGVRLSASRSSRTARSIRKPTSTVPRTRSCGRRKEGSDPVR